MINVLTMVFKQYLTTPFERFTDKYILARGIFQLLEKSSIKEADVNEIKFIEKHTSPKVRVSLYKLDRDINPTKGDFKTVSKKFEYMQDTPDKTRVTLTDNQIQQHLCIAIRRVHEIIMGVMKGYKLEQRIDGGGEDDASVSEFFDEAKEDGGTPETES